MKTLRPSVLASLGVAALVVAPVVTIPGPLSHPVASSVAVTRLTGNGVVTPTDAEPGTETREVVPSEQFKTLGVRFDSVSDAGKVEARVQEANGEWTEWHDLEPYEEGPDAGTEEDRRWKPATEPMHVLEGQRVQVRVPKAESAKLDSAEVVTIDPGTSAADGHAEPQALSGANAAAPMPRVVTRAQWGANESYRNCPAGRSKSIEAVTLHHTTGRNNYTRAESAALMRSIYSYHTRILKWCDVGYNAIIDRYGTIYEGRAGGLNNPVQGAHASGFNSNTWGISMLGDFDRAKPPAALQTSVVNLMAWKLSSYNRDPLSKVKLISAGKGGTNTRHPRGAAVTLPRIFGHRDVGSTSCPGRYGYAALPSIRQRVAAAINKEPVKSGVMDAWEDKGGKSGYFGPLVTPVTRIPGGTYARFVNGAIFETKRGIISTYGGIGARYFDWGGPTSGLGVPTAEEKTVPGTNGRYQTFSGANTAVYWSEDTGPQISLGGIRAEWEDKQGGAAGQFGFPTTEEANIPGYKGAGRYQRFQGGDIYWGPRVGPVAVPKAIAKAHASLGGAKTLGMPMSDVQKVGPGVKQRFELINSHVYGKADTGYFVVLGGIQSTYEYFGGATGQLGFPIGAEKAADGGRIQQFENGALFWDSSTQVVTVRR